jgi:hypothetical protein
MRINQDLRLSRVVTVAFGSPGRIGTGRIPDPEARSARFRQLCNLLIRDVSESWAEHLIERVGLRGEKAIKEFEKRAQEFVREAFQNNWRMGYAAGEHDKLFWSMAKEVVDSKTAELRSLWPGRGRRAQALAKIGTGKQATAITQLLNGAYKGKKTILAADLHVDLHTLNKVLSDKAVTNTTRDKIDDGLRRLSAELRMNSNH